MVSKGMDFEVKLPGLDPDFVASSCVTTIWLSYLQMGENNLIDKIIVVVKSSKTFKILTQSLALRAQ